MADAGGGTMTQDGLTRLGAGDIDKTRLSSTKDHGKRSGLSKKIGLGDVRDGVPPDGTVGERSA